VLVARIDGPLFFADADRFRTRLHELVNENGTPDAVRPSAVVIDADAVHLTDTDGADILAQVADGLHSQGTSLALAQVHPSVRRLWRRAGVFDVIGEERTFETVDAAVGAADRSSETPPESASRQPERVS
jgi:sulfate permease, SulP family